MIFHGFWKPFRHRFFVFFWEGRRRKISEEYNAKRGFLSPQKTLFVWLILHEMLVFFTNTLPELIFRALKCQPKRKKHDFGRILEPKAAPKWAFGATVFAEEEPTWSRLGGILAPKSVQGMELGWFWDDQGRFIDQFGVSFGTIYQPILKKETKIGFVFLSWVFRLVTQQNRHLLSSIRKIISASRRIFWHRFQPFYKKTWLLTSLS